MTLGELLEKLNKIDPVDHDKPVKILCMCHYDDVINHKLDDDVEVFNTFVRFNIDYHE